MGCLATSFASAGSIQFSNFVDEGGNSGGTDWIDFLVTIDDDTSGKFTILVEHKPTSPNIGDITGVFFDASDTYDSTNLGLTALIGAIESVAFDTNNLGGGAQVHPIPEFDVGLQYYGFSTDDLQTVKFSVNDLGLDLDAFTRIGLRAQSVAPSGTLRTLNLEGSTKEVSVSVVPLPAAVWGGLALMGCLGVGRRLRSTRDTLP